MKLLYMIRIRNDFFQLSRNVELTVSTLKKSMYNFEYTAVTGISIIQFPVIRKSFVDSKYWYQTVEKYRERSKQSHYQHYLSLSLAYKYTYKKGFLN